MLVPLLTKKSVTITSDSIIHDKATGTMTASGNVKIETAEATIKTDNADIKQNPLPQVK